MGSMLSTDEIQQFFRTRFFTLQALALGFGLISACNAVRGENPARDSGILEAAAAPTPGFACEQGEPLSFVLKPVANPPDLALLDLPQRSDSVPYMIQGSDAPTYRLDVCLDDNDATLKRLASGGKSQPPEILVEAGPDLSVTGLHKAIFQNLSEFSLKAAWGRRGDFNRTEVTFAKRHVGSTDVIVVIKNHVSSQFIDDNVLIANLVAGDLPQAGVCTEFAFPLEPDAHKVTATWDGVRFDFEYCLLSPGTSGGPSIARLLRVTVTDPTAPHADQRVPFTLEKDAVINESVTAETVAAKKQQGELTAGFAFQEFAHHNSCSRYIVEKGAAQYVWCRGAVDAPTCPAGPANSVLYNPGSTPSGGPLFVRRYAPGQVWKKFPITASEVNPF